MANSVSVKNLNVKFGDFYAVKDVTFDVKKGEIFGFLGANGAGKTTTIRVLCGILQPTSGSIEVAGETFLKVGVQLKLKVGYMSQKFTLYDDMTVNENLDFAGRLRFLSESRIKERKSELLDFIGWARDLDMLVKDLPGGQKQQVSLVASMIHDPEIIFLDEPTAGVSPASRARFWELIRKLSHLGKTVFVTTHYMDEAEQCDRIALMRSGELVELDSAKNLKTKYFPSGLFEIEPYESNCMNQLLSLKSDGVLSLVEPYGMRFHAEWSSNEKKSLFLTELNKLGRIAEISPSLEDVFIRVVEGRNR